MKKEKKAPELELVQNIEEDEASFEEQQVAAETKVRDELKTQNDIIKRGMVVQMVDFTRLIDEPGYFLVKGQIMTDVNGVPLFTEVVMKMTKNCLAKFINEAKSLLKNTED